MKGWGSRKVDVGQGCGVRVWVRSSALWWVRGTGQRMLWLHMGEEQVAGTRAQRSRLAGNA